MLKSEFIDYWNKEFSETYPINYELKWVYPDRWFRIHNLPESKRYAESKSEYNIILDRQNQLFNDLFGEGTGIIISFGLFNDCPNISNYKKLFGEFSKVLTINLKEERPEDFFDEDNALFDIYIKTENWKNGKIDVALKVIANDEIRAMFICPSKKCIIAPYDGGVDVIVDNTEKRNRLKRKYRDWLSKRKDGM